MFIWSPPVLPANPAGLQYYYIKYYYIVKCFFYLIVFNQAPDTGGNGYRRHRTPAATDTGGVRSGGNGYRRSCGMAPFFC